MKFLLSTAALLTSAFAAPTETLDSREPTRLDARAACASAVTLTPGTNPFSGRTLHANSVYAAEVNSAIASMTDTSLEAKASSVAKVGTFLWL